MERILVPIDFSPNAEKALDYAVQFAKVSRAELLIIHAVETYLVPDVLDAAREKTAAITKSIREAEQVTVSAEVLGGSVVSTILDAIVSYKPDLVIMGTAGSSGIRERLYGSKTAAIFGSSPVPVLAVPLLGSWKVPERIVLAVNKFDANEKQLQPVFSIAAIFGSEIQATTFTDIDDDYVEDYDLHEENVAVYRDKLKASHPGLAIHAVHLAGKHFRESLQRWIDNNSVDLLVMLTHKRSLLGGFFNPSVTKKMSYQTNIPLLAIPAGV